MTTTMMMVVDPETIKKAQTRLAPLVLNPELLRRLVQANEIFKTYLERHSDNTAVRIITHHDADGIASASILAHALLRKGIRFQISFVRDFDKATIEKLNLHEYPLVFFSDLGSGALNQLESIADKNKNNLIIFEHHQVTADSNKVCHVNCNLCGINGTFDASASTIVFLWTLLLDVANWDLGAIALIGAIGDRQHLTNFSGINQQIFNELKRMGSIETVLDLRLARFEPTIADALVNNIEPYIRGLTTDEGQVRTLLTQLDIAEECELSKLNPEQKRKLASVLILKLLEAGVLPEYAENVVITRYLWRGKTLRFITELEEFAHIINACGRLNQMALGFKALVGDSDGLETAHKIRLEYRNKIRAVLNKIVATDDAVKHGKFIQYVELDTAELAGAVLGLGVQYLFVADKPAFAFTHVENKIKVSARATRSLVARGLNLADACRSCAETVGGVGGGHPIAAGATIPKSKFDEFKNLLDIAVGKQLGALKNKTLLPI